jgi:neutral ceramidase
MCVKVKTHRNVIVFAFLISVAVGHASAAGSLRVGAAKVDITPSDLAGLTNLWGTQLTGVHDHIYARAIVIDNGETSAAIINVDTVEITDAMPFVEKIAKETGIPAGHMVIAGTHDHSAPMISLRNADGSHEATPLAVAFVATVSNHLVEAVKQAQARLQPARFGASHGAADINVNRDELTPRGYIFGRNPSGFSDKTVWVIRFEGLAGEPIALLINYAVHATVIGIKNTQLTSEIPGATSRFVEQHYGDNVVALWTSGAAGDQHPVIMSDAGTPADYEAVDVLGRILGEEVVRVSDQLKPAISQARIWGVGKIVSCPGQKIPGQRNGQPMRDAKPVDANPVSFRLGALMIDNVALTEVSAEVVSMIYQDLRKESPYANTIMITLANGRVGYIPDDRSYDVWTREAIASPLKKGCGESTIVNGLVELLRQY